MRKLLVLLPLLAVAALAGLASWRLLRIGVEADVYRARLAALATDYESLRQLYDQAVRRTAVTELRVTDGRLSVAIVDATGEEHVIDTPYDPAREIYVDFAVLDGRLWIRRVFDETTPPEAGLLIDPKLADVDWDRDPEAHGKAAYRSLGEGRWVVTVTGDGSLGLAKSESGEPAALAPPPPIREFEPIERSVDAQLGAIEPLEALRALAGRLARRAARDRSPAVRARPQARCASRWRSRRASAWSRSRSRSPRWSRCGS